jgi:NAD+ synthase (glutamine-hydrolysing)
MRLLGVACAALNQTPLDWEGNVKRIRQAFQRARECGAKVLCLPELCLTGYGCEDLFLSPHVQRTALERLSELAAESHGLITGVGLPLYVRGDCYNAVAVLSNGVLVGFVVKQHLAREGLYYEPRWFRAWPRGAHERVRVGSLDIPVGDLVFEVDNSSGKDSFRLGFEICEDAWAPQRPGSRLAERGVDLLLNPSASHFAFGRYDIRKRFVLEGARAFGASYLYANLLGNESGRVIFDGSRLIASGGTLVAEGERFGYQDVEISSATIDLDHHRTLRPRSANAEILEGVNHKREAGPEVISVKGDWSYAAAPLVPPQAPLWEHGAFVREEEFTRAVSLGLFDYLRKTHQRGFVLSLSGGADSACLAVLVRYMAEFAYNALGAEGVAQKLPFAGASISANKKKGRYQDLLPTLLSTVYQATQNSSEVTRLAALAVAKAVGAVHSEWNVQELVESYSKLVQQSFGREFVWSKDDITLQNIQSRVRAPGVWMLANAQGKLLLSTSNRSEAAVGYATMDGDTAGGLAPIAGINKDFIRSWLRWVENRGPEGLGPVPEVKAVNVQEPTAELRPQSENPALKQTDEVDLMPYQILDVIERHFVEEGKSPLEIFRSLKAACGEKYSEEELRSWIERFFRLFARNQWKRERYAPSFHLDGHSLDPKSWYRFPILSSGFEAELEALRRGSK